jgi:DNA-directed RNA polymerase beta subunit
MCDRLDATVFNDLSIETAEKLMKEFGIKDEGYKYLYNGDTGERIKARIFVAPTFYMRLQKFSVTAKFVTNQSTLDIVTR